MQVWKCSLTSAKLEMSKANTYVQEHTHTLVLVGSIKGLHLAGVFDVMNTLSSSKSCVALSSSKRYTLGIICRGWHHGLFMSHDQGTLVIHTVQESCTWQCNVYCWRPERKGPNEAHTHSWAGGVTLCVIEYKCNSTNIQAVLGYYYSGTLVIQKIFYTQIMASVTV